MVAPHGDDTWTAPVVIGGRDYHFAPAAVRRDGTQLWTAALGLAEHVAALDLQGSSVDLGCGCGLIGMVAGATLIDSDPVAIANTREILQRNGIAGRLLHASWCDISEPFDNIFGSEILYPIYQPATVAEFIGRCWTGRGVCLLAVSMTRWVEVFETRAGELGLLCVREDATFHGFAYLLIRVTGGPHA